MASVAPNVATTPEYAGTLQSLQLLVVRGIVDTEVAYLSNVRALPTPEDVADTYGTKGNLQYPPSILVHHVANDVTTYLTDLEPKFHPSFNSVAAAALIGVSRPLLSVFRGLDMERPGKLHASIMTSDRLKSTPGLRVGTSDHLETFGTQGFPGYIHLKHLSLEEGTGGDLWREEVFPQFGDLATRDLAMSPECHRVVEALSACITGMVPGGHFGALSQGATHKLTWLFPTSVPESMKVHHPSLTLIDFAKMKPADLSLLLSVWDDILHAVTHSSAADVLDSLSGKFAPMVKDLVRWGAMGHPSGPGKSLTYERVWRSRSLSERDRFFLHGRPLPIDESLPVANTNVNSGDTPSDSA